MATSTLVIGSPMPAFARLPEVSGTAVDSTDLSRATALVVVFSCNHCPYVQAYEQRMNAFQRRYAERGVRLVAINANDATSYPEDSFEEMAHRAKQERFSFLYLRDEEQSVARSFGATHTPEFFLFAPDQGGVLRLRYHGRMDDNHRDPAAVSHHYLSDAVDAVLQGREVTQKETHSIGCTIKWKQ